MSIAADAPGSSPSSVGAACLFVVSWKLQRLRYVHCDHELMRRVLLPLLHGERRPLGFGTFSLPFAFRRNLVGNSLAYPPLTDHREFPKVHS
jgi:hypothetical protein